MKHKMLKNTKQVALWLLIIFLSLGQFQRIELTTGINIYLHDLFIFTWSIIFMISHFKAFMNFIANKNKLMKLVKRYRLELSFILLLLISSTISFFITQDIVAQLYIVRLETYLFFAFSIKYLISKKELDIQTTRFQFFTAGVLILFLGFLQFIFIKDTRFLAMLGWDDHYNRLISTIFDPGFTGIIFVISMLYGLSIKAINKSKIATAFIIAIFSWGTILTFSRASYIALLTVISGLLVGKRIKKSGSVQRTILELIALVATISLLIFIAPKPGGEGVDLTRTASISARIGSVREQLNNLETKTVIIGNGLFAKQNSVSTLEPKYGVQSHSRVPDNIFVTVLLSTGAFGLILFILLLTKWSKLLLRQDIYLALALISILIHSQFNNSLLQPFVLLIFLGGICSIQSRA